MTGIAVRPIQFDELQIDDEIRFDGLAGAGRVIGRKAHAALVEARDVYSTARVLLSCRAPRSRTCARPTSVRCGCQVLYPRDSERRANRRPLRRRWRMQPSNLTGRPPLAG